MKKLSESVWSDIQDRSTGDQEKKEDVGKVIEIDGVKYTLMSDFWSLGDVYEEENSDEWTCFAFNKPDNSPTKIWGDTEMAGAFGCDKWDIGDYEYDVYVLRSYLDMDRDDYIQQLIHEGQFEQMDGEEAEIQDILVKYTKKIFEDNHMSEFAHYVIYEIIGTDYQGCDGIHLETDGFYYDEDEKPVLPCEADFGDSKVEDVHIISYPMLDNWYEPLRKELIDAYTKLGWKHLEQYELDPYDSPGNTEAIAFAKIKD